MSDTNEEAKGGEGGSEPITIRIRDQVRNAISVACGPFRWCRQILVNFGDFRVGRQWVHSSCL